MPKTEQPTCYKCGNTADIKFTDWSGKRIVCNNCDSKVTKHGRYSVPTTPASPEWMEKAKESEERIAARYGAKA